MPAEAQLDLFRPVLCKCGRPPLVVDWEGPVEYVSCCLCGNDAFGSLEEWNEWALKEEE